MNGAREPFVRVLRGTPTPEELAAATAVLLELSRRAPAEEKPAPVRRPADWHRTPPSTYRAATSWRR
ncbi:acyl-CoA carboxylase subunit epsilon [Streptomyces sp. LaBMicrA B280]|uniref:acyl-CoA carboxylase subunit epsilon n=1 Tax=Streptomyces sp. LaBMicrA B280 TaxID=3391001 RepID=UPI003BA5FAB8